MIPCEYVQRTLPLFSGILPVTSEHAIVWLRHAGQRLGLVPSLGGGVAAWQLEHEQTLLDVWRPWDGGSAEPGSPASFAMLPWSNRISGGGFAHDGRFHPVAPNRAGEPYPIHGDGWLQPWAITQPSDDTLVMTLESHCFDGNPYDYQATQTFRLLEGGLDQSVSVTHVGDFPLPYGLGLHPWFLRGQQTRLQAGVQGVWLSGANLLPTVHAQNLSTAGDLAVGLAAQGTLIDNAFTGWSGKACVDWPEQQLRLHLRVPALAEQGLADGFCHVYRPPQGSVFCLEPVTHPIDAFHLPGNPGLRVLHSGESLSLHVQWRFQMTARALLF